MQQTDVIIIGAGAAGLMCAIEAGKRGKRVVILDQAKKVGRKILISGGGRCNYTNLNTMPENFLSQNEHFCKSALSRYTPWDFDALVHDYGLSSDEKAKGQLFCKEKASAIVNMLLDECKKYDAEIILNCYVDTVTILDSDNQYIVSGSEGKFQSTALVVACGGPSIPKMGSSDFALQLAKQFGLKNIPFSPALVPFIFEDAFLNAYSRKLAGVACDVEMFIRDKNRSNTHVSFKDAILFTHRGISGPAALQISSYWQKGQSVFVNLFPNEDLFEYLVEQQEQHPQSELKTVLNKTLPKRLVECLFENLFVNKIMQSYKHEVLKTISEQLTQWELQPSGTEGMRTAEVALGGVDTDEISSKTFEAKNVSGLYFIGECLDVTGHLGGYNFQWAWASGWCAGQYV